MNITIQSIICTRFKKRQNGLSIIEVLVAAFVFSLGILGLSSTQLVGLKASSGTGIRTQAEFLASDILERMRANRGHASDYKIDASILPPNNPVTVAQIDLHDWKSQISRTLPGGRGSIDIQNSKAIITLEWTSRGEQRNSQPDTDRLVLSSEL